MVNLKSRLRFHWPLTIVLLVFMLTPGAMKSDIGTLEAASAPGSVSHRLLYVSDYQRVKPDADVAKFDGVIIQYKSPADRVAKLKALNPRIVVLYYRAAYVTWHWEENWSTINAHEDWFAHGDDGRRVIRTIPSKAYVMDLGNPEYRAYIIDYITNVAKTRSFDGVFIDGPLPTLKNTWSDPNPTLAFRTAWHANVKTFLRELKIALDSKLLITNSTIKSPDYSVRPGWPSPDPDRDDDDFLPYVDGTMIEGFAHAPWEPYTYIQGSAQWDRQQAKFQRNVDAGKAVFVLPGVKDGTAQDRSRWALFSYGSFLLRTDSKRSWFMWNSEKPNAAAHVFPELYRDLGEPAGGPYLANGLWHREFTTGKVLVNASGTPRTLALSARYRLPDGTPVTEVTLQPWTGTFISRFVPGQHPETR